MSEDVVIRWVRYSVDRRPRVGDRVRLLNFRDDGEGTVRKLDQVGDPIVLWDGRRYVVPHFAATLEVATVPS